jgi:alpha/beta superfamily hydrolase
MYGGSMDNNVILAVATALAGKGIIAFMFNFRGVAGSQGSFGNGIGEQQDVAAALSWLSQQPQANPGRLGLMGYSFGAAVALPVGCTDEHAKALALVSLPAELAPVDGIRHCKKPKLFISGGRDPFIPRGKAEEIYGVAAEPKQFHLVPGADHFWWGFEEELAAKVADFFAKTLS